MTLEAIRKQQKETQEALDLYKKVGTARQRRGQSDKDFVQQTKKRIKKVYPSAGTQKLDTLYQQWKLLQNEQVRKAYSAVVETSPEKWLPTRKAEPDQQLEYIYDFFTPPKDSILPVYDMDPSWLDSAVLAPNSQTSAYEMLVHGEVVDEDNDILSWSKVLRSDLVENNKLVTLVKPAPEHTFYLRDEIKQAVTQYESQGATSVSEVPLYFVILVGGKKNPIHMLLYLLIQNKVYTLGLGYGNQATTKQRRVTQKVQRVTRKLGPSILAEKIKILESALYSPDFVLNVNKRNKIVDVGILTSVVAKKIDRYLHQCNQLSGEFVRHGKNQIELESTLLLGLQPTYSTLSSNLLSRIFINCTSFITSLFGHIQCQGSFEDAKISLVSLPHWCESSPPWTDERIQQVIETYKAGDVTQLIPLVKRCKGTACNIMGGRHTDKRNYK